MYNCRICWNTSGWTYPTGDASALEGGTYVATHGFGHEEWLLNPEWVLEGRKFGHLQPVAHVRGKRAGTSVDLFLHTRAPERRVLGVATIREVAILSDKEAALVKREFERRGWLGEMAQDLAALSLDAGLLLRGPAHDVFNVAFEPTNLAIHDPPQVLEAGDPRYPAANRYILTEMQGGWSGKRAPSGSVQPTKTVENTQRRAIAQIQVQLRHTRLQNEVLAFLRARGVEVLYEKDRVDLWVTSRDGPCLLELKTAPTARACIREALGQLLEYAHFGKGVPAAVMAVVGRVRPNEAEVEYLRELRRLYRLPLEYWAFRSDRPQDALEVFPAGVRAPCWLS